MNAAEHQLFTRGPLGDAFRAQEAARRRSRRSIAIGCSGPASLLVEQLVQSTRSTCRSSMRTRSASPTPKRTSTSRVSRSTPGLDGEFTGVRGVAVSYHVPYSGDQAVSEHYPNPYNVAPRGGCRHRDGGRSRRSSGASRPPPQPDAWPARQRCAQGRAGPRTLDRHAARRQSPDLHRPRPRAGEGRKVHRARAAILAIRERMDDTSESFEEPEAWIDDPANKLRCQICGWTTGMICPERPGQPGCRGMGYSAVSGVAGDPVAHAAGPRRGSREAGLLNLGHAKVTSRARRRTTIHGRRARARSAPGSVCVVTR